MTIRDQILQELGVSQLFDPAVEANHRIAFLADYLRQTGARAYVLGISGGIDSTTAGLLAANACAHLKVQGYECKFIAVRLPYGTQADEADAQRAIEAIGSAEVHTVDIKPATDAMLASLSAGLWKDGSHQDFVKGNIKARQRMIAQYAIAGAVNGLVIGTDHNAEAVMGFFTKFGDGAADVTPLVGLNKRQVRAVGKYMGAPDELVTKTPTADLEDLDPAKPDEKAYGVTYDEIDDFLEGKPVTVYAETVIINQYRKTMHKRGLPIAP